MKKYIILLFTILLIVTLSIPVLAIETGGEINLTYTGIFQENKKIESNFTESLNLKLFIPQFKNNELHYEFKVIKPVQDLFKDERVIYTTKKLYLKHEFTDFHLTVGRQPISWSFGSLFNPVDYNLGAVALNEEGDRKYTDAIEAYIPINWNSNISLVTSFPRGFTPNEKEIKWGLRSRMGFKGYDLTLNYVQEPEKTISQLDNISEALINGLIPDKRVGMTGKGDFKNVGLYGAFGYYFADGIENKQSYLLGVDYSYKLNYYTKIRMQLEYLGLKINTIDPSLKNSLFNLETDDNRFDLLTGSINYPITDFSSVSLTGIASLDDKSLLLIPSYQNTLPGNIDLTLSATISSGDKDSIFRSNNMLPEGLVSINLSYPF